MKEAIKRFKGIYIYNNFHYDKPEFKQLLKIEK